MAHRPPNPRSSNQRDLADARRQSRRHSQVHPSRQSAQFPAGAYSPFSQTYHPSAPDHVKQAYGGYPSPPPIPEGEQPNPIQDLYRLVANMQDDIVDLQARNATLNNIVNEQRVTIAKLESEIDSLDQYSRRENVLFTNLLIDDAHSCEAQVIDICNELGVDVAPDDLVATHPLPGKKGKGKAKPTRYIARFKDRAKAQKVFKNRKATKTIAPDKKQTLFADPTKGVAVQPNITAKRAVLLGQVKDAVEKFSLNSYWVDTKNCNIMLRLQPSARPIPIMNTCDLLNVVPNFGPKEFVMCVDPRSVSNADIFSPDHNLG